MQKFAQIVRHMFRQPGTYIYLAVAVVGAFAAHLNSGLRGSPWLGATSIASFFASIAIFYWQAAKTRQEMGLPGKPGAVGLFLSVVAFRVRLFLVFLPVFAWFFWKGYGDMIAKDYVNVAIAPAEEKFSQLFLFLQKFWLPLLVALIAMIVEFAGKAFVVAQGYSDHALKRLPRVIRTVALPLAILIGLDIVILAADEYVGQFEQWRPWGETVTPGLLYNFATIPVEYALTLGGLIYLAVRLREKAPELVKT